MKASRKEIGLLLGLLGILAGVIAYFLYFSTTQEKSDALANQNMGLASEVAVLEQLDLRKADYQSEIVRMNEEMENIYAQFPVDVREEDSILMAINQEILAPMSISGVTINGKVDVDFTADKEAKKAEHIYDYDDQLGELAVSDDGTTTDYSSSADIPGFLQNRQVTLNYTVDYEGMKRSVEGIVSRRDKTSIESINLAYDESTGLLSGSAIYNMYCIPYQEDKEYVAPDFSAVILGTDNIFGTLEASGLFASVTDEVSGAMNE